MSEIEEWRDVIGYEGHYQVSDQGRVKSLGRVVLRGPSQYVIKEKLLRPAMSDGYPYVRLSKDGKSKGYRVHILVAAAFIGPRPHKHDVCHRDGKRDNPRLTNLRYGTRKENMGDAILHGTMAGPNNGNAKLTGQDVSDILNAYIAFEKELALKYGVSPGTIRSIKMGRTYLGIGGKKKDAA